MTPPGRTRSAKTGPNGQGPSTKRHTAVARTLGIASRCRERHSGCESSNNARKASTAPWCVLQPSSPFWRLVTRSWARSRASKSSRLMPPVNNNLLPPSGSKAPSRTAGAGHVPSLRACTLHVAGSRWATAWGRSGGSVRTWGQRAFEGRQRAPGARRDVLARGGKMTERDGCNRRQPPSGLPSVGAADHLVDVAQLGPSAGA